MSQAFDSTVWLGIAVSLASASAAALLVRGRIVPRCSTLVALSGSSMGLLAVCLSVAGYRAWTPALTAPGAASVERFELCVAACTGALIFAMSAIAFCKLQGVLPLRAMPRHGHDLVNAVAVLLCAWLGYGFVTEAVQPFGLAALLAMSALASSIGVHVMLSREYSRRHAGRSNTGSAMVRAPAYRQRRHWHNNSIGHRLYRGWAARHVMERSVASRQR